MKKRNCLISPKLLVLIAVCSVTASSAFEPTSFSRAEMVRIGSGASAREQATCKRQVGSFGQGVRSRGGSCTVAVSFSEVGTADLFIGECGSPGNPLRRTLGRPSGAGRCGYPSDPTQPLPPLRNAGS